VLAVLDRPVQREPEARGDGKPDGSGRCENESGNGVLAKDPGDRGEGDQPSTAEDRAERVLPGAFFPFMSLDQSHASRQDRGKSQEETAGDGTIGVGNDPGANRDRASEKKTYGVFPPRVLL